MKVLLISHNPIATHESMGKTMFSLFSCFSPEELCQFYIYPSLPDIAHCCAYYRMTDKAMLRRFLPPFRTPGEEVSPVPGAVRLFEHEEDEALYRNPKNKSPHRALLRDLMWKIGGWHTRALRAWIERERPDVIFLAPGAARFIYRIAARVAKEYRLPIVTYICDDYYFVERPATWLGRVAQKKLSREIAAMQRCATRSVVICPSLKEAYEAAFTTPCEVVMTGASSNTPGTPRWEDTPRSITYMGNIRCNRYLALAEIGQALHTLNQAEGTAFTLDIYTPETNEEFLAPLRAIPAIRLCGFVSGEAYAKVASEARLFLHTEARDEESIDLVKHSVSTKIADCLSSGIPLLAYGPATVASMRHLLENNCALCACRQEDLFDMLHTAFFSPDSRRLAVENAQKTAAVFHNREENSRRVRQVLEEAVHENSAN